MTMQTQDRIIDIPTLDLPARDRSLTRIDEPALEDAPAAGGGWILALCIALAVIWIAGCAAYLLGFAGIAALTAGTPAQIAGLIFVIFGPALFVLIAGITARQTVRFSAQARLVARAARRLARPERELEGETRALSNVLAGEMARVNSGMDAALARLAAMEEVIRHHADALADAATNAGEQSRSLIVDLRAERDALGALADVLDAKARMIADAIGEQSRMVARAAELAEGAANEGKAKIELSAAALQSAGTAVLTQSEKAAGALSAQHQKLDMLAGAFAEQSEALSRVYDTHRDKMGEASRALREEQARIASALDFHRAELGELVKVAGKGATEMTDATRAGGETLRGAVEEALGHARQLGDLILTRTESMAERQNARLAALDDAAVRARAASEAATAAFEAQAMAIHKQVDRLGEATLGAAARAGETFENRIAEAKLAVERVASLADEADAALAARFERSLETWRAQLADVERRVEEAGASLGAVPHVARERIQELETAVRKGIEGLRAAARTAAEEAREIDSALQARMRHNYELLSEFVMRIGSVSVGAPARAPMFAEAPRTPEAAPEPRETPRASDLVSTPGVPTPKLDSGLSWRDIVSSLRESETTRNTTRRQPPAPAHPPAQAPGQATAQVPAPAAAHAEVHAEPDTAESLGADPSALTVAAARDAAHARRSAGIDAMREAAREHAPDHVALLARTFERDPDLRARVRRLVDATDDHVAAASRDDRADRLIEILSTPAGRGYLLLSAALGGA